MKVRQLVATMAIILSLSACASSARIDRMAMNDALPTRALETSEFRNNLRVTKVTDKLNEDSLLSYDVTGSVLQSAIEESLRTSGLSTKSNPEPRFEIHATLMDVEYPFHLVDVIAKTTVAYEVIEKKSNEARFKTIVSETHRASISDSFLWVGRLKLAHEGSVRKNIRTFFNELLDSPLKKLSSRTEPAS